MEWSGNTGITQGDRERSDYCDDDDNDDNDDDDMMIMVMTSKKNERTMKDEQRCLV